MARIPRGFIDDLLARVDLVDLIDARVKLKKQGKNYGACCPFHNEKTPSFSVSPEKQFYHCFGCGVHGNAIDFIMEYDRLEFVDAIEELASQCGMEVHANRGKDRNLRSNVIVMISWPALRNFISSNCANLAVNTPSTISKTVVSAVRFVSNLALAISPMNGN